MSLLFKNSQNKIKFIVFSVCSQHLMQFSRTLFTPMVKLTGKQSNCIRYKSDDTSSLFVPIPVKIPDEQTGTNVGEELTTKIEKDDLLKLLNQFYKRHPVKLLSQENGLDDRLFHQAFISFRRYCLESESLPVDLHIVVTDILHGGGHADDLFPYFLRHARLAFPHLSCLDDLKKISDVRMPANWYPQARLINRKIIFHAGPTNSGKTYHALKKYMEAKSGVYCGPLKLLAVEVFTKTNENGTPCDLITGEERQFAISSKVPSSHVSCTVEMASVNIPYDIAVIDEIQMIRDPGRGWAWTRALYGIAAKEIHLCGEPSTIDLINELCLQIGEEVEVRNYERLTSLTVEDKAVGKLSHVKPGDCIVCFSKNDIYHVSQQLEKLGHQCAVIYGGLPPGTKLAQAKKFNDPDDPCKILVATDAIGMGLNLCIRRIVFYSLIKPLINEKGEKEMTTIPPSQALQIAGRAGRYGTQFSEGFVTAFKEEDVPILQSILSQPIEPIQVAGLHPTADQIELFAYHLPQATLSNLMNIFVGICQMDDSKFFMCNVDDFKFLADMIQHVPLPLRARYVFCCAPINRKMPFVCTMFLKFAHQYSRNELITYDWLHYNIGWPFKPPMTIMDLIHLEAVFDVLDLYLWLSYRFTDLFPDGDLVRDLQKQLDSIIQKGVFNITQLLQNSDSAVSHAVQNASRLIQAESALSANADDHHFGSEKDLSQEEETKLQKPSAKVKRKSAKSVSIGHGRLADHLIAQGLLTPRLLEELKNEWKQTELNNLSETKSSPIKKTRKKKGK